MLTKKQNRTLPISQNIVIDYPKLSFISLIYTLHSIVNFFPPRYPSQFCMWEQEKYTYTHCS